MRDYGNEEKLQSDWCCCISAAAQFRVLQVTRPLLPGVADLALQD